MFLLPITILWVTFGQTVLRLVLIKQVYCIQVFLTISWCISFFFFGHFLSAVLNLPLDHKCLETLSFHTNIPEFVLLDCKSDSRLLEEMGLLLKEIMHRQCMFVSCHFMR